MGAQLIADYGETLLWIWAILKVVIGLGLVIFVHELGHFLVAKICGVKCEKFYVGFDVPIRIGPIQLPASLCKFQWGETEYGIGVIPLGGYVKMLGQDDNPNRAAAEVERVRLRKEDGSDDDQSYVLDPRSYPAKPVLARMAIISAGVVMNLIFAVVFAVIAYRAGVDYQPTIVGGTAPGSAAWVNNLQPGDQIVQIGKQTEPDDKLRWNDMIREVVLADGAELGLVVRRGSQDRRLDLTPRKLTPEARFPVIGVRPATDVVLPSKGSPVSYLPAGQVENGFQPSDRIVAIDGQPVSDGNQIQAYLAQHPTQSLQFTVERGGEQPHQVDVVVPPNPLRDLGIALEMGPILAVQNDSPAAAAGFQVGDILESFDGQPITDPLTASQQILPLVGQTITVEVKRNGETVPLRVTPVAPLTYTEYVQPNNPISVDELGVAYTVKNRVVAVAPGSPAEQQGIEKGDLLIEAAIVKGDEEQQKRLEEVGSPSLYAPVPLGEDALSWPTVFYLLQQLPPDTQVQLTYSRDGQQHQAVLNTVASKQWYFADRGILLPLQSKFRVAESWSEALMLGARETWDRFTEVLRVLARLLTGRLNIDSLAGPVGIFRAAGYEAHHGIPQLLLFLTMLSANLAIINFLPIPVLDGGHMVFLSWELIVGRPVDENIQTRLSIAGLLFLVALIAVVSFNDITRIFSG